MSEHKNEQTQSHKSFDENRKGVYRFGFAQNAFHMGTAECALFCGAVGLIAGTLLITVGLWKTLLVAVFTALGVLLGGTGNKKQALQTFFQKILPKKKNEPYRVHNEDIEAALKNIRLRTERESYLFAQQQEQDQKGE